MSKEDQLGNIRSNFSSEIRKQNRDSLIKRQRKMSNENQAFFQQQDILLDLPIQQQQPINQKEHIHDPILREFVNKTCHLSFKINQLHELVTQIFSQNDVFQQHYGVIGVRKVLSVEKPPIQDIINANLIPRLVQLMSFEQYPHLQLEAAWALTNVASGTTSQTQLIIDQGGIPLFVKLLINEYPIVAEQSLWAIGNIAGDSSHNRDNILEQGGLINLCNLVMNTDNRNIIKHGTWAVSNLCRGRPLPSFDYTKVAIPCLIKMMSIESDYEILQDSLWALSYLTDGDEERIQMNLNLNILPGLIKNLSQNQVSILIPTIRCLGNLATGSDDQSSKILDSKELLEKFIILLRHDKPHIRREVCWSISNFTASTNKEQIRYILQQQNLVPTLMEVIAKDQIEVKKEALWVFSNATHNAYFEDVVDLVRVGWIQAIHENLDSGDSKILEICLEALSTLFELGTLKPIQNSMSYQQNGFCLEFEKQNSLAALEVLQNHEKQEISERAIYLLTTFFNMAELTDKTNFEEC